MRDYKPDLGQLPGNSTEQRQRARLLIADRHGGDHDAIRELFDALALWPRDDA